MHRAQTLTLTLALTLTGCKSKHAADDAAPAPPAPKDAAPVVADAADAFPELSQIPHVDPVRVIALPTKIHTPRLDVGGPVIAGELAVVAASDFGFIGVDYHRGQIVWTKTAGMHVAPPLVVAGNILLIGDCTQPPDVPATEALLGCLRVVNPTGSDLAYVAIHGKTKDVEPFGLEPGVQRVWSTGPRTLTWKRGERAVSVDTLTGVATPAPATDPPVVVHYKTHTWQVSQADDGTIVAREAGKQAWRTSRPYTTLLGAVYLPEQSPMVRLSNAGAYGGHPELLLFDIDATGSMHGQVAMPVPGIALLGHAIDVVGDVALAVRLDASLERDFIAGYAANALLMWVYPLPQEQRVDPIGLALAPDAVVVFHHGDTLTILPELSAPPTAPGAARVPSENSTP